LDQRAARFAAQQQEIARSKQVAQATATLKKSPHFAAAQFRSMDEADKLIATIKLPEPALPSPERLDYALKLLDIRAGAILALVSDLSTQEAFTILLAEFMRRAWEEYAGISGITPMPQNTTWKALQGRVRHWQKESYKQLIPPAQDNNPAAEAQSTVPIRKRQIREPKPELLKNPDATLGRKKSAEALGISERTLDRWVGDDVLVPVYRGSQKRFKTQDLLRIQTQKKPRQK